MHFVGWMKNKKFDHEDVSITKAFQTLGGKIFQPSDSGLIIPTRRGVDLLYRKFKNHLMETPIQKYRRLKSEIETFQDSLKELADKKEALNSMPGMVSVSKANDDL